MLVKSYPSSQTQTDLEWCLVKAKLDFFCAGTAQRAVTSAEKSAFKTDAEWILKYYGVQYLKKKKGC